MSKQRVLIAPGTKQSHAGQSPVGCSILVPAFNTNDNSDLPRPDAKQPALLSEHTAGCSFYLQTTPSGPTILFSRASMPAL